MQGSYLLANPSAWSAMFWNALPRAVFWPMFIVATLAAIIASQAMISAVFQIVKQAIAQGFFPRFHVYHTSRKVRAAPECSLLCIAHSIALNGSPDAF